MPCLTKVQSERLARQRQLWAVVSASGALWPRPHLARRPALRVNTVAAMHPTSEAPHTGSCGIAPVSSEEEHLSSERGRHGALTSLTPNVHINIIEAAGTPPRARDCVIPPLRRSPQAACLTDFLEATPDLMDGMLPHSRRTIGYVNRLISARPQTPPSATTKERKLYSPVGGAVDRGVLFLSGFDVAAGPRQALSRRSPRARQIAAALAEYQPPRRGVLRSRSALGWLYLLAVIDPVLRGFRTLDDVDMTAFPGTINHGSVTAWLETLIPIDVSLEIAQLLRTVRDIRLPGPVLANPIFGGLGLVSGSDGDWIAGDTLVEMKCTTGGVQRIHAAQLLCYYVFDQARAHGRRPYGFGRLALCLPRQSCTLVGSVDEWLQAFGAPRVEVFLRVLTSWFNDTPRPSPRHDPRA